MPDFSPVGGALPPRRDSMLVQARDATQASLGDLIIVPKAQDRALEFFEREWKPTEAKTTVGGRIYEDVMAIETSTQGWSGGADHVCVAR